MESKYRWRTTERICPHCKKPAIIKGKAEYGGGWLCWKKKDGCGQKFDDQDRVITDQEVEKIENPDIIDCVNTVLKMAQKRAMVAASLSMSHLGDVDFTLVSRPGAPREPVEALVSAIPIEAANTMMYQTDGPYALSEDPPVWDEYRRVFKAAGDELQLEPIEK